MEQERRLKPVTTSATLKLTRARRCHHRQESAFAARPKPRTLSRIIPLLLAVTTVFLSGCDFVTGKISLSDPRLAPMLQAIAASDRTALGFAPIPTNAAVHLDRHSSARYDAMLIIYRPAPYARDYSNIELRKTATGYQWIREYETHYGPKTFTQSGHTAHESICIAYDTDGCSGLAPGEMAIIINGPSFEPLENRHDLTLEEVRPILKKWSQKP